MLIDVTLQEIVGNGDLVQGAALAGGAGYVMWHEQDADRLDMPPGSCRSPRGNPAVDDDDLARAIAKLERICGS